MTAKSILFLILIESTATSALGQPNASVAPTSPADAGTQPSAPNGAKRSNPAPSASEVAAPTPSDAPESESRQQARQRFENGMRLYEEGDYALALLEFERAHSLVPGFRVLYNIGQVNIQLGRYARAMRKLQQYIVDGGDQIPPDRKAAVLADLEMLAGRTASIQVSVNTAGAEIVLDNDVLATSPMLEPQLVDAGEHRVTVRKAGFVEFVRPLALAGRDQVQLDVKLTELPKISPTERTVILERPRTSDFDATEQRRQLWLALGWTGTGLLAATWGLTGYMGITSAQSRDDRLRGPTSAEELTSLKQKARNWYIAADISGGLTLAAATTMLYYTFVSRPTATPSRIALGISPNSVLVSGRF